MTPMQAINRAVANMQRIPHAPGSIWCNELAALEKFNYDMHVASGEWYSLVETEEGTEWFAKDQDTGKAPCSVCRRRALTDQPVDYSRPRLTTHS